MGAAQSSSLAGILDPEDVPQTLEKLRAASIRSESDLTMLNAGEWLELRPPRQPPQQAAEELNHGALSKP